MSTYSCSHNYCPHLHYKKCKIARLQSIPYTIFPDGTIDSFTNLPSRCGNLYKSNIPTVAYENYTLLNGSNNKDTNFVKNYYFDKDQTNNECTCNSIVKDLEEDMYKNSAYILAGQESKNHAQWSKKHQADLQNARNRAISRYNEHFKNRDDKKQADKQQNDKWLKKLYRKLQQVARHIIEGDGETQGERQRKFLLSKTNLTANYLSKIKIRNPKNAFEILEELRTLMLKKKLKFQDQRQQQQHNKSASMSFASESGSQSLSQNSMLSQATSLNESKAFGEDEVMGKFCDFEALKKKWRCQDVEEVKEMIRRVLTSDLVRQGQGEAIRKKKQAQKNNLTIKKTLDKKKVQSKDKGKKSEQKKKLIEKNQTGSQKQVVLKSTLTGQEEGIKSSLIKGGQFDAAGEKFQRARNYSQMFKRKQQQNLVQFTIKQKTLQLTRDCYCPNS